MDLKHRILTYRLGSLGDTIMALPAFHGVRRAFPDERIVLLTNRPVSSKAAPVEAVLGRGFFFDSILDYPLRTRNPVVLLELARRIRSLGVDTVVNLAAYRSDFATMRDGFFFRAAGIRRLVGFKLSACDKRVKPLSGNSVVEWEASRISRRVREIADIDLADPKNWDLRLSKDEMEAGKILLGRFRNDGRVLAFSTGTKVPAKHWGLEKWASLSKRLSERLPDWKAVFFGSHAESPEAEFCAGAWGGRALNLCGKSTPRESAAAFAHCGLFVGHDSGPMHLAACMGVPCVAVFSARNPPGQWFPRGDRNVVIQRRPACAGCGLEACLEKGKQCLEEIGVDEVERAVLGVFS
jgi:heptosyltransferase-3